MKRIPTLLCLITLLGSCTKETPEKINPEKEKTSQDVLLELVNNYRQKGCNCGSTYFPPVAPVAWNNLLESVAQGHSDDMSANKYFSHTGSDGSDAGNRLSDAGYNWSTYGENIGTGYRTEEEVVSGWINSEGHCKNIMNPNFKEMGVARQGTYWTQILAKRRN